MRRHIPGVHLSQRAVDSNLDGAFLVRVEGATYRGHREKPFLELHFVVSNRNLTSHAPFPLDYIARSAPYGSLIGFLPTSAMTPSF